MAQSPYHEEYEVHYIQELLFLSMFSSSEEEETEKRSRTSAQRSVSSRMGFASLGIISGGSC